MAPLSAAAALVCWQMTSTPFGRLVLCRPQTTTFSTSHSKPAANASRCVAGSILNRLNVYSLSTTCPIVGAAWRKNLEGTGTLIAQPCSARADGVHAQDVGWKVLYCMCATGTMPRKWSPGREARCMGSCMFACHQWISCMNAMHRCACDSPRADMKDPSFFVLQGPARQIRLSAVLSFRCCLHRAASLFRAALLQPLYYICHQQP
jgi:hypothetical protein